MNLLRKLAVVVVLLSPMAANADLIYTDWASWTAATSSITTLDFEGMRPEFSSGIGLGTSTTIGGVTFESGNMYVLSESYEENGERFCLDTGDCLLGFRPGLTVLHGATTSLAFDVRGYNEESSIFSMLLSDGQIFDFAVANPVGGFWGITTDVPITSILIGTRSLEYVAIDNFSFGTATSVPEPSTLALLSIGLFGMAVARRRRQPA